MWHRAAFATLLLATTFVVSPAYACIAFVPVELADIEYANVVVIGRIDNYKLILDPVIRQKHANSNTLSPETLESYKNKPGFISDYATFDVLVDEVLMGQATQTLAVTWDASTFSEAETMPPGPFLIALRDPSSRLPPLRGTGTIFPNPEPGSLTILQAPCSGPFIFEAESDEANAIRQMLKR